ncbi:uncharacterized protein LAJ45_08510 [Morchella importuna]|uniref:uncharacterized protein n=1 Tax=Morchella importuna TaxID=1174673 RepID=UPI001E8DE2FA|nr:uncharacterized protein LAJ45_08510 [Morchella importuna]KAH8147354.1 hypothetical protein LAJ45_08510 [Morchella importuna]
MGIGGSALLLHIQMHHLWAGGAVFAELVVRCDVTPLSVFSAEIHCCLGWGARWRKFRFGDSPLIPIGTYASPALPWPECISLSSAQLYYEISVSFSGRDLIFHLRKHC